MTPKTIQTYGGPYADRRVVRDPSTQMGSTKGNVLLEDVAQMTRTPVKARVAFQLATSGSSIDAANVTHTTLWGSGSLQKPTVARSGTGVYVVTWPSSLTDGLGETESLVFTFEEGTPNVRGSTDGRARIVSIVSNVVTVNVYNTSNVASDLGGSATVVAFGVG